MAGYFFRANSSWDAGEHHRAFRIFLTGAKSGDASCQSSLGYFYDNGIGVKKNIHKALFWYEKATKEGRSAVGAHNAAMLYLDAGDVRMAEKYFKLSVEYGNGDSLLNLSDLALRNGKEMMAIQLLEELLGRDRKSIIPATRESAVRKLRRLRKGLRSN